MLLPVMLYAYCCGVAAIVGNIISLKHAVKRHEKTALPVVGLVFAFLTTVPVLIRTIFINAEFNNVVENIFGIVYIPSVVIAYIITFAGIDDDTEKRSKTRYIIIPVVVVVALMIFVIITHPSAIYVGDTNYKGIIP